MKKIFFLSFFCLTSCSLFEPSTDERICYKDVLNNELYLLKEESELELLLESREDRHMIWVEKNKNNDRYRRSSCILRDQFKTKH